MRIKHQFIPKKVVEVAKQNDRKTGVPPMPTMRWNRNGSPDCSHLNRQNEGEELKMLKGKNGIEVYPMPRIDWRKEVYRCQQKVTR
jgi:hypothetical protein